MTAQLQYTVTKLLSASASCLSLKLWLTCADIVIIVSFPPYSFSILLSLYSTLQLTEQLKDERERKRREEKRKGVHYVSVLSSSLFFLYHSSPYKPPRPLHQTHRPQTKTVKSTNIFLITHHFKCSLVPCFLTFILLPSNPKLTPQKSNKHQVFQNLLACFPYLFFISIFHEVSHGFDI